SRLMLEAMGARAVGAGLLDLFGPVRPTGKHEVPHVPMADYALATRHDGLPADPWLRVHVRMGGRIVTVAPSSMVIPGTLREWREWTGLPFDRSGDLVVPFACNPVHVSVEQEHAVYVEPNVWVHHDLRVG
ncbi:MAG: N-acetyltransferase, partial [Lapillicoccus sp.]